MCVCEPSIVSQCAVQMCSLLALEARLDAAGRSADVRLLLLWTPEQTLIGYLDMHLNSRPLFC